MHADGWHHLGGRAAHSHMCWCWRHAPAIMTTVLDRLNNCARAHRHPFHLSSKQDVTVGTGNRHAMQFLRRKWEREQGYVLRK